MKNLYKNILKKILFKRINTYSLSDICLDSASGEPIVEYISTEYNGKKSSGSDHILDIIIDHRIWKNFNKEDKYKILTHAFEFRQEINLHRYSVHRVLIDENNENNDSAVAIHINDKLTETSDIRSFPIQYLVEQNPGNILCNMSAKNLKQIFFFYYFYIYNDDLEKPTSKDKPQLFSFDKNKHNVIKFSRKI